MRSPSGYNEAQLKKILMEYADTLAVDDSKANER